MTLGVLACFLEFHRFIFDEIDMGVPKIIYKYIWWEMSGKKPPMNIQGSFIKDPTLSQRLSYASPIDWGNQRPVALLMPRRLRAYVKI